MTFTRAISHKTQTFIYLTSMMLLTASVAIAEESKASYEDSIYLETCLAPVKSEFKLSEVNKTVVEHELSSLLFSDDPAVRAAAKSLLVGLSSEQSKSTNIATL